ncbi:MAG: carboxypeptidase regulatory-like domain-containing protein [Gemmataceae bacterium]|nr:carboxypeptidase regulatory-like domain-containing protein [Gemmataceae bacterium]
MRIQLMLVCIWTTITMLTGCGPGQGDVSGTVMFQQKPVAGGTVTFYDEANGVASDTVKDDGSYTVKNVGAGAARIAVIAPMAISMPGLNAPKPIEIPAKYADRLQSGLTYQVTRGSQTHNITLD